MNRTLQTITISAWQLRLGDVLAAGGTVTSIVKRRTLSNQLGDVAATLDHRTPVSWWPHEHLTVLVRTAAAVA